VITTARFHTGERWVAALVRRGRSRIHITFIDDLGIRHQALPLFEERSLVRLRFKGKEYPIPRMVKQFRAIGRARGITEAAKEELSRASAHAMVMPA
jgi:hypothetical protein